MYANLPFRNIRDVLGLHAKTTPHKTFLVYYDADAKRHDFSYAVFTAMVHQTANLLYEDLRVQRGDMIAVAGRMHPHLLAIEVACWLVGATLVLIESSTHENNIERTLIDSKTRIAFVEADMLDKFLPFVVSIDALEGVIQVGGERREDVLLFSELANNRPISFLGDDIGAKGGDIPLKAGDERTAQLDDNALWEHSTYITQGRVLAGARALVEAHTITGNTIMLNYNDTHKPDSLMTTFLASLYAGATLILPHANLHQKFWEFVVRERVHIATLTDVEMQALMGQADVTLSAGLRLFGEHIMRQDIKQFRHVHSIWGDNSTALKFETVFGFSVMRSAYSFITGGVYASMPITLDWQSHQNNLAQADLICTPLRGYEVSISDTREILVRGNGLNDWLYIGTQGLYNIAENRLVLPSEA